MSQLIPPSPSIRTGSCVPRKAYGRFEFLVCDWTLMKKLPGDAINSQTFIMADDSKWMLQIFPGGKTERQAGFVTTEVVLTDMGDTEEDSITATINLSVLSQRSEHAHDPDLAKLSFKSMVASEFRLDDTSRQVWAVDNFSQTSVLEQKFVLNDTVLFAVEIEVLGLPGPRKGAMPVDISTPITLQDDLSALLDNPQTSHTDITLVVEGKKYYCHKCILAARSYFFREKFLNSTFNAKLVMNMGKYHVVDMNSSIFGHVLQYIYSDKCSHDALATSSTILLTAASKLKVPGLISHCEDYIGETLTPDTVAAMFNLAVQIKSDRLASCCSDFITAHINCVLSTNTLHNLNSDTLKNLISRSVILAPTLLNPPTQNLNSSFEPSSAKPPYVQLSKLAESADEMKDPLGTSVEQGKEKEQGKDKEKEKENVDESMIGVPPQDLSGSPDDVVDKGVVADASSTAPAKLLGIFQMR